MIYGGEDILFLGKPLFSGRETIFISFYEVINSSLVFGNIGNYHFSNMLNAYITIFSNIGFNWYSSIFILSNNLYSIHFKRES